MKEFVISKSDEGQRLDKFITRILRNAPASFAYKMLRKKNIVLNDKKASGAERLSADDVVKFYLSDETFDKFYAKDEIKTDIIDLMPPVVYEDEDIIILCKPAGMLSQKSAANDVSLNEICLSYTKSRLRLDEESYKTFTPGICNRLDRNTSGLVTFAKTYKGSKLLTEAFRSHKIGKYYKCIVIGQISKDLDLTGSLIKDNDTNTVTVTDDKEGQYICTKVHPIKVKNELTFLEVELITGKTHQIRAHLASIGHPIIGDVKYGDDKINRRYKKACNIDHQMLVCTKMVFPDDFGLDNIAGKTIEIDIPESFKKVMLCQPGILED